jgi:hypothetical protein
MSKNSINRLAPLRICPTLPHLSFQSPKQTAPAFEFFGVAAGSKVK